MKTLDKISLTERIESLKAGLFGAFVVLCAFCLATVGNSAIGGQPEIDTLIPFAIRSAIALLSGFLFGVTYRYAIRDDRNPHLKSGVVLAFGLVRGLAQVDGALDGETAPLFVGVWAIESVLFFAIAAKVLDWAIDRRWVKPLNG
ncbi:MAG: hypothetical protein WBB29_16640 [Geitlerinemataceae cyanobacterium]